MDEAKKPDEVVEPKVEIEDRSNETPSEMTGVPLDLMEALSQATEAPSSAPDISSLTPEVTPETNQEVPPPVMPESVVAPEAGVPAENSLSFADSILPSESSIIPEVTYTPPPEAPVETPAEVPSDISNDFFMSEAPTEPPVEAAPVRETAALPVEPSTNAPAAPELLEPVSLPSLTIEPEEPAVRPLPVPSFEKRYLASVVDYSAILFISVGLEILLMTGLLAYAGESTIEKFPDENLLKLIGGSSLSILALVFTFYFLAFYRRGMATPGKNLQGVKLENVPGLSFPGRFDLILREYLKIIGTPLLIVPLWTLKKQDGRGPHDMLCKTRVSYDE